jgi:hypothetical protein
MVALWSILKFSAAFSGVILLLALAITAWLSLMLLLQQVQTVHVTSQALSATMMVASLAGVLILVALGFLLLRTGFRWLRSLKDAFGTTSVARMLGLALTTLVFPKTVYLSVSVPIRLVADVVANSPRAMLQPGPMTSVNMETLGVEHVTRILTYLTYLLQQIGGELGQWINAFLQRFPVTDTIVALAFWIVAGQAFSPGPAPSPNESAKSRVVSFFSTLTTEQQRALALACLFLLGGYLSITATVAIPWLKPEEESSQQFSKDNLGRQLQDLATKQEEFDLTFPLDPRQKVDPLAQFESQTKELKTRIQKLSPATLRSNVEESLTETLRGTETFIGDSRQKREQIIKIWTSLRQEALQSEKRFQNQALSAFETEMALPTTNRERGEFFANVKNWYRLALYDLHDVLHRCMNAMQDMDSNLYKAAGLKAEIASLDLDEAIRIASSPITGREQTLPIRSLRSSYKELSPISEAFSLCQRPRLEFDPPEKPDPGRTWGIFGTLTRWLLQTKSFPLALITGMLGFGILGASISSLVRTDTQQNMSSDTLAELGRVVVRGLSAAVIVFLAVKGGLAAFTTEETSPNAYVLFLTCLIGAVYSEKVWEWARTHLSQKFDQTTTSEAAPSSGTATTSGTNPPVVPAGQQQGSIQP